MDLCGAVLVRLFKLHAVGRLSQLEVFLQFSVFNTLRYSLSPMCGFFSVVLVNLEMFAKDQFWTK